MLYKILDQSAWQQAKASGVYPGSPLDLLDGFIHLSAGHQVAKTASLHFAGQTDLILVAFADDCFGEGLKWEASRGGDLFPHVYGTIDPKLAAGEWPLPWRQGGHVFPEDFQS